MRRRFPSVSALEFRWRRVSPSANQNLTFKGSIERISCITKHVNFHREVIGQFYCKLLLFSDIAKAGPIVVEPFKWKTSEFTVIWFRSISNKAFNREKPLSFECSIATWPISPTSVLQRNISYALTFTRHLDSLLSNSIISVFHNSSRCSAVIWHCYFCYF